MMASPPHLNGTDKLQKLMQFHTNIEQKGLPVPNNLARLFYQNMQCVNDKRAVHACCSQSLVRFQEYAVNSCTSSHPKVTQTVATENDRANTYHRLARNSQQSSICS